MRQAILVEPKHIEFREVEAPKASDLKEHQVLLNIKRIGICGSEIHSYHGCHPATFYPVVQGHEYSAVVVATGAAVTICKAGDVVTARPQLACGKCKPCQRGEYNICEELRVQAFQANGAAQDFFVVDDDRVAVLPEGMSLDYGAMIEPVAVGNTDTGYLINAEGMICGLSGDKEVIKDGVLYFPEEGCSGIARGALSGLGSAVEEIEIPANITNIQPGAFVGLSNLGWIEADAANPAYVTIDGVLYTADGTVLLAFPAAWTGTFQVPESVKSFAESAFDGTNLECIDARSCTLEQAGSIPETVKLLE